MARLPRTLLRWDRNYACLQAGRRLLLSSQRSHVADLVRPHGAVAGLPRLDVLAADARSRRNGGASRPSSDLARLLVHHSHAASTQAVLAHAGNTYKCREYINSAGGWWQAATKTSAMDDNKWAALVASKPNLMRGCMIVGDVGGEASATLASGSAAARDADRPYFATPRKLSLVAPCRLCQSCCYGDCQA